MDVENLLANLHKVRRTGDGRWVACCPAHEDRSPSLSVRALEDGRTLIHCFAGCSIHSVVASLGIELSDLFPDKPDRAGWSGSKRIARPFSGEDALRCVAFEATLVTLVAGDIVAGKTPTESVLARVTLAADRISMAMEVVRG